LALLKNDERKGVEKSNSWATRVLKKEMNTGDIWSIN